MNAITKAKDLYLKHFAVIDTYSMSKTQKKVYAKQMATISANECFGLWCDLYEQLKADCDNNIKGSVTETESYKYWMEVINQIYKL